MGGLGESSRKPLGLPPPPGAPGRLCRPLGESASLGSHDQQQGRPQASKHRVFVTASWPEPLVVALTTSKVPPLCGGAGVRTESQAGAHSHLHAADYTGCLLASAVGRARLPYRRAHELVCTRGPRNHPGRAGPGQMTVSREHRPTVTRDSRSHPLPGLHSHQ